MNGLLINFAKEDLCFTVYAYHLFVIITDDTKRQMGDERQRALQIVKSWNKSSIYIFRREKRNINFRQTLSNKRPAIRNLEN